MYDMYPDWGPAKHDPDHPLHHGHRDDDRFTAAMSGSTGTALRDEDDQRPDDN